VSALSLQTVEGMLDDPDLLAVCADAVRETIPLAAGVGRPIETSVEARLDLARQLGPFRTSMLEDFEAGGALEIAAMLDAPIEIGRLVGVPTPVLETLARLTRAAVLRRNRSR
jgi:2-dehydropantoate 2-reductase